MEKDNGEGGCRGHEKDGTDGLASGEDSFSAGPVSRFLGIGAYGAGVGDFFLFDGRHGARMAHSLALTGSVSEIRDTVRRET